jgi:homoserine kinase type II
MAVFTSVTAGEAAALAQRLQLGALVDLRGISAGIENSNFFLTTDQGEWVLTLFERLTREQLPFYLELMKHLAGRGIPVPDPQADRTGAILHEVAGKPAAVVNRLRGAHSLAPTVDHCEQVGAMLARMHLAGQDFPTRQENLRGLAWWQATAPVIEPFLTDDQRALLTSEVAFQTDLADSARFRRLPRGPVHGDLFRDNVMFDRVDGREQLSGFFDFYFAGVDSWVFDVAVCVNDWCVDLETGVLDLPRAAAFVAAYERERALSDDERACLPAMLRAGALRFWISRLWDFHLPREASMLKPHDPMRFERVLRERRQHPWPALETGALA